MTPLKFLKRLSITILAIALITVGLYAVFSFAMPDSFMVKIEEAASKIKSDLGLLNDSGITGEGYTFDEAFYPYHHFLSDDGKKLYAQVYANAYAMETTFVPVVEVRTEEVKNVINAVYHDHPELFWMDSGYTYKYVENDVCVHITLNFNETADYIDDAKKTFEDKANAIIQEASDLSSDFEKEKFVYHMLIEMVEYDTSASVHQSPYSALVNGKSVCAGYARAFQYIMIELGIPTYYCAGQSEGHAWNIVKLENGYYNVDLTWADRGQNVDAYLNRTDESLSYSHKRSGYSVLLPNCKATKYSESGME